VLAALAVAATIVATLCAALILTAALPGAPGAALAAAPAVAAPAVAAPQKTQAQLRALREQIERITQQVSRDAVQRDRLSAQLRSAELSVAQAQAELDRIGREYAERSERRGSLGADRAVQQRALEQQRLALSGQVRAAYLLGREEPLKLLLAARDPLRSQRLFTYYGYFCRARAREITDIRAEIIGQRDTSRR